ncbi:MAG: hypothetical protein D6696_09005, partial [Acidobacteria bacterium]
MVLASASLLAPGAAGGDVVSIRCRDEPPMLRGLRAERLIWQPAAAGEPLPELRPDAQEVRAYLLRFAGSLPEPTGCSAVALVRRVERRGNALYVELRDLDVAVVPRLEQHSLVVFDLAALRRRIERLHGQNRWSENLELIAEARRLGLDNEELAASERRARLQLDRQQGLAAFRQGRYREAVAPLARVAKKEPRDLDVCLTLARAHYRLREYGAASTTLARLQRRFPDQPEVAYLLGLVELSRDNHELAIGHFRAAVAAGYERACFYLGYALYEQGNYAAARRELERFLEYDGAPADEVRQARRLLLRIRGSRTPDNDLAQPDRGHSGGD